MTRSIILFSTFFITLQLSVGLNAQDTPRFEWDLTDIYSDVSSWESAMDRISLRIDQFQGLKGTLGSSAQSLLRVMREY